MSTLAGTTLRGRAAAVGARAAAARALRHDDVLPLAAVAFLFAAFTAVTWRKWGVPTIDAGYELTVADSIAHGSVAYRDVRYFYGPLGVYGLAGAFDTFGTTLTVAYAFGLTQALAIVGTFYALARRLLPPLPAALGSAIVMSIGFSGTAFNFVLPHTNSATFGLLLVLLMLLALSHRRLVAAGVACGLLCLTRPEFAAVGLLMASAFIVGTWRQAGWRAAARAVPRLGAPVLVVGGGVLAAFAATAGTHRLLWENLWPLDFLRVTKFGSQSDWAPINLTGAVSIGARAAVYCLVLAAVLLAAARLRAASGARDRVRALAPIGFAMVVLAVGDLVWRASGIAPDGQAAVEEECRHLLIGMSWLPALGFAAVAVAGWRFLRRGAAPLSGDWAFDLAMIAGAAALGARAYDAFTTEASYAPYYAAPLVLLCALLHHRIGERRPASRGASMAFLACVAVAMAAYSLIALYPNEDTEVHTPRGTFMATAASAAALQPTLDLVARTSKPGERILAVPADAGIEFMTGRRPALYDLQFLPGLLDSRADEVAAIQRLRREEVRTAVVASRRFVGYGFSAFGRDYNGALNAYIHAGKRIASFGTDADPAAGTNAPRGYSVWRLRP